MEIMEIEKLKFMEETISLKQKLDSLESELELLGRKHLHVNVKISVGYSEGHRTLTGAYESIECIVEERFSTRNEDENLNLMKLIGELISNYKLDKYNSLKDEYNSRLNLVDLNRIEK